MNRRQAGNVLTIIDLLENWEENFKWDFSVYSTCALGCAERNKNLLNTKSRNFFYPEMDLGQEVSDFLWGYDASDAVMRKVSKKSVVDKLRLMVDKAGWEEA